ncbi:MAG: ABC transporter permease [Actinomycetes bacterium]
MGWLSETVAWLTDGANWSGPVGVPTLLVEHLRLTVVSLLVACLVGLPVAVWLGHVGRGGVLAVQVSNVGRAVPVLAVLVLLVVAGPPFGFSDVTAVTAFTLFAVPPIVTNAYVGMREVDRGAVDAARGMGMTSWQVLRRVELPLAAPLILGGVRLAAVQLVATVSIAAIAAFGGLGRIVTRGFANQDVGEVIAGAFLIAVLALATELGFELLASRVDPGRRVRRQARRRVAAAGDGLPAGAVDMP